MFVYLSENSKMAGAGDVSKKTLIDLKPDNSLLNPDFDGYKLSLEPVPTFETSFNIGVSHIEPTSEQYSYQHVRLFGLHNHLYGDPWRPNDVYYFNEEGTLIRNTWDGSGRRFSSSEVWSESFLDVPPLPHEPGDYNYSLSLDCRDKAFVLDGRKNGTLRIITTGDREHELKEWSKDAIMVPSIPAGIVLSAESGQDGKGPYHCLLQSVVEAATISELKEASKEPGSTFATLLQWITIGNLMDAVDSGASNEIIAQRHVCVHGPLDYAALEPGACAIYVASQKEAFFAQDTTRPITPPLQRALRKPVHYTWEQTESHVVLRFTLPFASDDHQLEVLASDPEGKVTVSVVSHGENTAIISGVPSLSLSQEEGATEWSVQEARAEVRLQKGVQGEAWSEFIPGDKLGQPAPDPELVREAREALSHLTSEKEEEGDLMPGYNCGQLEECDAPPPDSAMLVRLADNSHTPTHRVQLSAHQWVCGARLSPGVAHGLVLRHDVDALAWQPQPPGDNTWKLTHAGTFPAFGYVQASKEQKKFIVCPPDLGFIAICESSPHVYIYHQPAPLSTELRNRATGRKVEAVARQQVTRTPASVSQVLGAHAVNNTLFVLAKNTLLAMPIN